MKQNHLTSHELMEQTDRILEMEHRMERAASAVTALAAALGQYEAVLADLDILGRYYGSDEWRRDFADDEAGLLPQNLKRGVLSEDGLWNLLSDNRELMERLKTIAAQ